MPKGNHIIFGVHVTDRITRAVDVQDLFTKYGCNIKTRIGLHQVSGEYCAPGGVILLEMFGDEATCYELRDKLSAVDGIEVKEMVFSHD